MNLCIPINVTHPLVNISQSTPYSFGNSAKAHCYNSTYMQDAVFPLKEHISTEHCWLNASAPLSRFSSPYFKMYHDREKKMFSLSVVYIHFDPSDIAVRLESSSRLLNILSSFDWFLHSVNFVCYSQLSSCMKHSVRFFFNPCLCLLLCWHKNCFCVILQ